MSTLIPGSLHGHSTTVKRGVIEGYKPEYESLSHLSKVLNQNLLTCVVL
jgi:hypothetical protein